MAIWGALTDKPEGRNHSSRRGAHETGKEAKLPVVRKYDGTEG